MILRRRRALVSEQAAAGRPYLEFLRVPAMSVGLYALAAGAIDRQSPHAEDEVYVVLRGVARFSAGGEVVDVQAGDTIFVPAGEEHRFHDISEDLELIVIFAPSESGP